MQELVDFVQANEPRIIAYNVYFSDDGTRMTVVHVHPDSTSLEYHMEVVGPVFRKFVELVSLSAIHIYGEPSEKVLSRARMRRHECWGATLWWWTLCTQGSLVWGCPLIRQRVPRNSAEQARASGSVRADL